MRRTAGHCKRRGGAFCALLAGILILAGCAAQKAPVQQSWANPVRPLPSSEAAQRKLGIQVVALHLSEGGNILDLRYKVVDPARAHTCLSKDIKPVLVDPASGARLAVPDMAFVGALRQTAAEPLAGKVYFILFWNPRVLVKAGQKVNLVMGDVTVKDLVVG